MDAARLGHPQQTAAGDVGHDQADLINVAHQQHFKIRFRVQCTDHVAGVVGQHSVTVGAHFFDHLFLQRDLVAGDGHAVQQRI